MVSKITSSIKDSILQQMVDSVSDICIATNAERCITLVNPAFETCTGFSKEEFLGKKDTFLFRKEWRAAYTSSVFKQLSNEGEWSGELSILTKQKGLLRIHATITALYDTNKKFAGSLFIGRDISGEWNSIQQNWKKEGTLQNIFSSLHDAVIILDASGKVIMNNEAVTDMFGCSNSDCLQEHTMNSWVEPSEHKRLKQALTITDREGFVSNFLLTSKKKDQSRMILSCSFSKFVDSGIQGNGYVVSLRDVTNVHYSDELAKSRERMERLVSEIHRKTAILDIINEIHRLVLKKTPLSKIFKISVEGVSKILEHDLAGIYIYHPEKKQFLPDLVSKQTPFSKKLAKFPLNIGEGIIGTAALSGDVVLINNAQNDPRSIYPPELEPPIEHFIAAPMVDKDRLYGIMVISRNRDPEFIEEEAMLLKSFTDATTIAFENANLLKSIPDLGIERSLLYRKGKRK